MIKDRFYLIFKISLIIFSLWIKRWTNSLNKIAFFLLMIFLLIALDGTLTYDIFNFSLDSVFDWLALITVFGALVAIFLVDQGKKWETVAMESREPLWEKEPKGSIQILRAIEKSQSGIWVKYLITNTKTILGLIFSIRSLFFHDTT